MKFHQNISTRCKIINILVCSEYVYKVELAILGLNGNNFAMSKDILMKLHTLNKISFGTLGFLDSRFGLYSPKYLS